MKHTYFIMQFALDWIIWSDISDQWGRRFDSQLLVQLLSWRSLARCTEDIDRGEAAHMHWDSYMRKYHLHINALIDCRQRDIDRGYFTAGYYIHFVRDVSQAPASRAQYCMPYGRSIITLILKIY